MKEVCSEEALSSLSTKTVEPEKSLETLRMALAAVEKFIRSRSTDERFRQLRHISQLSEYLPDEVLQSLAAEALQDEDFRIRGEMCYALGMSGVSSFIPQLQILRDDPNSWVRKQAQEALQMLERATPTASDYRQLLSQVERLVTKVKAERSLVGKEVAKALSQLSKAEPGDILGIAVSQISILGSYYDAALIQARNSFRWVCVAAFIGLIFFVGAVVSLLVTKAQNPAIAIVATIGAISGAVVEVISGLYLFVYGKATTQLAHFLPRLDQTQRFLLANTICESLKSEMKQNTRAELVKVIATWGQDQTKSPAPDTE